jgi:transcriptional regulator EpsA
MQSAFELTDDERIALMRIIQQSLGVQRHVDLFLWLQGEIQAFIPHDILIAAWGDFSLGLVHFDVTSALPGVRTVRIAGTGMTAFVRKLFNGWVQFNGNSFMLEMEHGFKVLEDGIAACPPSRALRDMKAAIVHGIKDERGRHDCLYICFSRTGFAQPKRQRHMVELLAPYLDTALRRIQHLPEQRPRVEPLFKLMPRSPEPCESLGLSMRELEIMEWVRKGKTNQEIGMILNISVFTVKNHLQRVFKKLDVLNRAQAVARTSQAALTERV